MEGLLSTGPTLSSSLNSVGIKIVVSALFNLVLD